MATRKTSWRPSRGILNRATSMRSWGHRGAARPRCWRLGSDFGLVMVMVYSMFMVDIIKFMILDIIIFGHMFIMLMFD